MTAEILDTADRAAAGGVRARRGVLRALLRAPVFWVSGGWIALVVASSLFSGAIGPQDPLAQDVANALRTPSAAHWLGTDPVGRDVLSRLIAGAAQAVGGAALAVGVACLIGVPLGLLAGYAGRLVDQTINRFADFLFALPGIVLILALVALYGTSTFVSMTTLGVLLSAGFIRLVRAATMSVRSELFVDAAKVSGLGNARIVVRHVLPNVAAPLIVQVSLALGAALEIGAGLGFLGLGPAAPAPSWGGMVLDGAQYIIQQPWLMVPPGIAIIATILAFNFLGDAIRDAGGGVSSAPITRYRIFGRRPKPPVDSAGAPAESGPVLEVRDLAVEVAATGVPLVRGVSFTLELGKTLGLVGESGSGKTVTSHAILGLLAPGLRVSGGAIAFRGTELTGLSARQLAEFRGGRIGFISQEPMVALDPSFTVLSQLKEPLRNHAGLRGRRARQRARELLTLVGIKRVDEVLGSYPHQLSGGMAQRVAIAIALTGNPELLIADEPTTALDVTVQAEILDLLRSLQESLGMAILLVTHDFGVVADICDDIVVMQSGALVERAPALRLFARPEHPYTQSLLAATPENWRFDEDGRAATAGTPLLEVANLRVEFRSRRAFRPPFQALKGVSIDVRAGETVGLVGESGSGKTTLGRAILGLVPVVGGTIRFAGEDVTHAPHRRRQELSQQLQVVFQDPYSSLNPRMTVSAILTEPLRVHGRVSAADAERRVRDLLDRVQLPSDAADRYPLEFSGGQRQRIAIARALVMEPRLIVCDEALSSLDLTTQQRVVELLRGIQRDTGVAYLFIAHDLSVVRGLSDRVSVMYLGEIVETGTSDVIGDAPTQDYTRRLLLSAPVPDPVRQQQRREARQLASAGR